MRTIKEKFCYVSQKPSEEIDFVKETKAATNYMLPDGNNIALKSERTTAPEILFQPSKVGLEYMGVHELILDSIKKCDIDLRKSLFANIITAGGSTLFHGFSERLHNSLKENAPKDMKVN